MAVSGTRHMPARTPAMPTSAYGLRGRDGNALQRERHERRSVRRAQRGAHEQRRRVHASHQTSLATQTAARSFTTTSSSRSVGGRDPERASLGAEHAVDVVEPLVGHPGKSKDARPNAKPPKGACNSLGTPNPPTPRSRAVNPPPSTDEEARNATAVAPHARPSGRYSGNSARFLSSNAGTKRGLFPEQHRGHHRRQHGGEDHALGGERSETGASALFQVSLLAAGWRMDSNAKNNRRWARRNPPRCQPQNRRR